MSLSSTFENYKECRGKAVDHMTLNPKRHRHKWKGHYPDYVKSKCPTFDTYVTHLA